MDSKLINVNVGILGHVDSGKTSIAKALSTVSSTACFDKNPQSKERGITLDLGFSSFTTEVPPQFSDMDINEMQYTLVDCPGHASLIKTIIGGVQIIDLMLLVIDVTKGIQTQTAECLVIGEIACKKMIIVLNKIDLIPSVKRDATLEKMKKKLNAALETTTFAAPTFVAISACPNDSDTPTGIEELKLYIQKNTTMPVRNTNAAFVMAVDHCFSIKGQGTVLTGTILSGSVHIGDMVEIPALKLTKKTKSIQMFRKPVSSACQGDRIGLCFTQFDPKLIERGLVGSEGHLKTITACIAKVSKIKYFKGEISSKIKYHVTVGHETVLTSVTFFSPSSDENNAFDLSKDYQFKESLDDGPSKNKQFALLEFLHPITIAPSCVLIGSRFDSDINLNSCRIAFQGELIVSITDKNFKDMFLPQLHVYKEKTKIGQLERCVNTQEAIIKNLFKKESNIQLFCGMKVTMDSGEVGVIVGSFGQSGKVKVQFIGGISEDILKLFGGGKKKAREAEESDSEAIFVTLKFRKYIFDQNKKIMQ